MEGNFVPRRYWGSGRHILTQMGTWAVGIKPPFAKASGDEPPRPNHPRKLHFRGARYRATPPLDEELRSWWCGVIKKSRGAGFTDGR